MKLYHGSNMSVESPEIKKKLRALDFGPGFYLTSSEEQAKKWAKSVTKRRNTGAPIVNVYDFEMPIDSKFSILEFKEANGEWLDFVVANRKGMQIDYQYDIVIGPVANDSTIRVIDLYMDGIITKELAVQELLPQNLTDQYAFLSDRALSLLHFEEAK